MRTKRLRDASAGLLAVRGRDKEQAQDICQAGLEEIGFAAHAATGLTKYLLYVGQPAQELLADYCDQRWDDLAKTVAAAKKRKEATATSPRKAAAKTAAKKPTKQAQEQAKPILDGTRAVDVALFGRLIVDNTDFNVKAAFQVAHALSTHAVVNEFDYYTALDDLRPDAEPAADMIGTVDFNAACFYRYANLDQLAANLPGDAELVARSARAWLYSFIHAVPGGKQNSMAARTMPQTLVGVVRETGAWSLANVFLSPVADVPDLMTASTQRLFTHFQQLRDFYFDARQLPHGPCCPASRTPCRSSTWTWSASFRTTPAYSAQIQVADDRTDLVYLPTAALSRLLLGPGVSITTPALTTLARPRHHAERPALRKSLSVRPHSFGAMMERSDHVSREATSSHEPASWRADWTCGSASDPRLLRTFSGHEGPVVAVATVVVDGRPVVVSASRDATVCVWDLATGERLHTLTAAPPDDISSLSPELVALATVVVDGHPLVLTCHTDGTARLWDPETGRSAGELALGLARLVLDGRHVVLAIEADRTLGVWDQATGSRLGVFPWMVGIGELDGRKVVVTCPPDDHTQVWDLATGREVGECLPAEGPWTLEGRHIAVTKEEGQAGRVWDLDRHVFLAADLRELLADAEYGDAVSALAVVDTVSALTVVDGRVVVLSSHYEGAPELVGDLAPVVFPDGPSATLILEERCVALAVGVDHTLRFWDLPTSLMDPTGPDGTRSIRSVPLEAAAGKELIRSDPRDLIDLARLISARTNGLLAAECLRAASRSLVLGDTPVSLIAGPDGTVTLWHTLDPSPAGSVLTGHTDRVWAIASTPVGTCTLAVTTSRDRTVRAWDLATGEQEGEPLTGHTGQVWDVATTTVDGRGVAVTAGEDHTVRTWDLTAARGDGGRLRAGHTESVLAVATAVLDGVPVLVTAGADHAVRTWDLTTGSQTSDSLSAEVSAMTTAVVGGHSVVVTAAPDATLHILELATGKTVHRPFPSGHGRVLAMASATLDGLPVALTAGSDRVVGVWDLTTGQPLVAPLTGHSSRITAAATTVLGGQPVAVTGSWDKTVRLWDIATGRQLGEPLTGHTDWVTAVATAMLGGVPIAISKSRDRTIRLWNLSTGQQIRDAQAAESGSGNTLAVSAMADGRLVAALGDDRTVRFRDLTAGCSAGTDHLLPFPVHSLAAAPGGRFAVGFGCEVGVLSRTS